MGGPPEKEDVASRLSENLRKLREARGATQAQMAKLAGLPRATWANLESDAANPTLAVLSRVASALQVSIEELVAPPRPAGRLYPKGSLPVRKPAGALVRHLLPDPIPGMAIERLELGPRARMTGVPHTPGSREYLTCESGRLALHAGGERFELSPGDVVVFHGDQRHSYHNPGAAPAVGYSVVVLARVS